MREVTIDGDFYEARKILKRRPSGISEKDVLSVRVTEFANMLYEFGDVAMILQLPKDIEMAVKKLASDIMKGLQ